MPSNDCRSTVRLSKDAIEGESYSIGWFCSLGNSKAHYDIWRHAQRILAVPDPGEQDLCSAMIQLDRAVDLREKLLNSIYHFRRLPGMRGKDVHVIMVELGIIKPLMKTRLATLRNALMHVNNTAPPDLNTCRELSEFAWYYLRSTDRLISDAVCEIEIDIEGAGGCRLGIHFGLNPWAVSVDGRVPSQALSVVASTECVEIASSFTPEVGRDGTVRIVGTIVGSNETQSKLVRLYFETA
jgi:hypothetical protein